VRWRARPFEDEVDEEPDLGGPEIGAKLAGALRFLDPRSV
jgi:hypothetical protein